MGNWDPKALRELMHNILSHRDSGSNVLICSLSCTSLSSFPFHFSSCSQQRGNDSFSLPGFEPLAVYTVADGFMLRFYNLAGVAKPHLHTYSSALQTYTLF